MAFLDPQIVSVDAVLTKKGRELLARNDGSFLITQFSLADDEVDYSMYNPNHPSGSAFYGEAIEYLPLLEAFPDETQVMKYKLLTLPPGTSALPILNLGYGAVVLKQGATLVITPQTLNYLGAATTYEPSGYTMTVGDARLLSTFNGIGIDTSGLSSNTQGVFSSTQISKTNIGTSFTLVGTTINTLFGTSLTSLLTTLTVVGRDSGARTTIPLTVTKNS